MGSSRKNPVIFLSSGEPSGDIHGARLVRELRKLLPGARFLGLGGPEMANEGVEILIPPEKLAIVGFQEALLHIKQVLDIMKTLVRKAVREADLAVFIDYPGFNLRLARYLHNAGIKTVYYIVPQVWAWGTWRTHLLRKYIDRALVILPFEEDFLRKRGVRAEYVGHPLIDMLSEDSDEVERDGDVPHIAMLPGSRVDEIRRLLPRLINIREEIRRELPGCRFLFSLLHDEDLGSQLEAHDTRIFRGRARGILRASDYAIVASGTVSLEAGLLEKPMSVLYMLSDLSWFLGKRLAKVPYVSLVNILLGREVVREYIQHIDEKKIAREAASLLLDPDLYRKKKEELRQLRQILGAGGATKKAAMRIAELLG